MSTATPSQANREKPAQGASQGRTKASNPGSERQQQAQGSPALLGAKQRKVLPVSRVATCARAGSAQHSVAGPVSIRGVLGNAKLSSAFQARLMYAMQLNLQTQLAAAYRRLLKKCAQLSKSHKDCTQSRSKGTGLRSPAELSELLQQQSREHFAHMGEQSSDSAWYDALKMHWSDKDEWARGQAQGLVQAFREAATELVGRTVVLDDLFAMVMEFAYNPTMLQRRPLIFAIAGTPGSGKTTLATRLGKFLGLSGMLLGDASRPVLITPEDLLGDTAEDTRRKTAHLVAAHPGQLLVLEDHPRTESDRGSLLAAWDHYGGIALTTLRRSLVGAVTGLVVTAFSDRSPPRLYGGKHDLGHCLRFVLLLPHSDKEACAVIRQELQETYGISKPQAVQLIKGLQRAEQQLLESRSLHDVKALAKRLAAAVPGGHRAPSDP